MAEIDVKFDGWSLVTNANFTEARVDMGLPIRSTRSGSAQAFHGAAVQGKFEGRRITVVGTVVGSDASDANDKAQLILSQLGGVDRQRFGRLDLYGNGHYWCQLDQVPTLSPRDPSSLSMNLQFFAPDPFRRSAALVTKSATPASPDFEITVTHGSDFDGDVPRIPLSINLGSGWQKDELVRIENTTIGWFFEHVVTQNLTGVDLVIDGDNHEVLEGGVAVHEGTAATFPYLRGGTTNVLDFTDCDRFQSFTLEFYDRFWS